MTLSWILVANASEAKIFKTPRAKLFNGGCSLELVTDIFYPDSRLKESELTTTLSGHKNILETADPKWHEHEKFARVVVDLLEDARTKQHCQDIIVVAPAGFYGLLNRYFRWPLKRLVSAKIEKDYTKLKPAKLSAMISEQI